MASVRQMVVVACVGVVVAACGGSGGGDDDAGGGEALVDTTAAAATTTAMSATSGSAGTAPADVTTPAPTDEPAASAPTGTDEFCPLTGGDMDGCFDYDGMQAFYDEGIAVITAFIDDTFADPAMQPAQWIFVEEGATGQEPCTVGEGGFAMYTDASYEYCPLDQTVYVGQRQLWDFYDQAGDAAAVVGMAHEAGHHIQAVVGVGGEGTLEESIVLENQADCVAGTFTAWLDSEGLLDYPDDLDDIDRLMTLIASAEDDPERDHGTLDERIESFIIGYEQGIAGCSEFFPETPLAPAP